MKRDMELIRKILLAIEEQYVNQTIFNLKIEGYDFNTVAYHCKLMNDAGLITHYEGIACFEGLTDFIIGSLSWSGHEFLDKIRDETVWNKTKEVMKNKGIPFVLDAVKQIASTIVSGMVEGAIKGINL
jgi:hypothetical protein